MATGGSAVTPVTPTTDYSGSFRLAGVGISFRGKPKVKQSVSVWLDYAGATGLLYLQGYKRSEFVEED